MEELPLIKLEIEQMKHQVYHHFVAYQERLTKQVKKMLEDAIENFDYESAVKEAAGEIIKNTIGYYFKYGDGRVIIESSLQNGLDKMFSKKANKIMKKRWDARF